MPWFRESSNPDSQIFQAPPKESLHLHLQRGVLLGDPARVSAQVDAYRKEDQNPEHGLNDLRLVVEASLPADSKEMSESHKAIS